MFKNRKAISKLLAAVMAISMLPAFAMTAGAEETITWGGGFTVDFDEMTSIADTENILFHSAESPTLIDDGNNGQYLSLTNNNTSYTGGLSNYTAGQWGAAVKIAENADADYVKITYKAKVNQPASDTTASWGSSSVADKVVWYGKGTTAYARSWGVRACVNQTQFFGATASTTKKVPTGEWIDIEYVYDVANYTTSAKISQNGAEINSGKYTTQRGPIQLLLLAARGGNEAYPVYYDDITVSYGTVTADPEATATPEPTEEPTPEPTEAPTPAPVAEDFEITFDGMSAIPADTAVVTYNENIAVVENDALKITGSDGNGAVIVNILESDAKAVEIEFDAKLTTLDVANDTKTGYWQPYDGIHTKFKPASGNRFYAVRLSPVYVQLHGSTATEQAHPAVTDYYHVKHVYDYTTKALYTTVSVDGKIITSDIKTEVNGFAQYNFGTDNVNGCIYDNIKVSYIDTAAEYAQFAREVQLDRNDETSTEENKGTLRFKAGLTNSTITGDITESGFKFVNTAASNNEVVSMEAPVTTEKVVIGDVFYYDVKNINVPTISGEGSVILKAGFYAVPYVKDADATYYGVPFTFKAELNGANGEIQTETK